MKYLYKLLLPAFIFDLISCNNNNLTYRNPDVKIIFLHHSTGLNVWKGEIKGLAKFTKRLGPSLVPVLLKEYNKLHGKRYAIYAKRFPTQPYPWENYPYDYYNIWVKHGGDVAYMNNPSLEMLTANYSIIIFKHCFPGSNILKDDSVPDIDSKIKTLANYKLQYIALKRKLKDFPNNKFIIWTGAALVEKSTTPEEAKRAKEFHDWVINEWDEPGDNIFIFDFREIETEGGLFLKHEYACGEFDSHPNEALSVKTARLFVNRIIEVIENK